jgi:hypothetical protein
MGTNVKPTVQEDLEAAVRHLDDAANAVTRLLSHLASAQDSAGDDLKGVIQGALRNGRIAVATIGQARERTRDAQVTCERERSVDAGEVDFVVQHNA